MQEQKDLWRHKDAGKKTTAFELGDRSVTLADVMIARSKAGIGSDAAIQIRNKAIEGYKEIMSMPVWFCLVLKLTSSLFSTWF